MVVLVVSFRGVHVAKENQAKGMHRSRSLWKDPTRRPAVRRRAATTTTTRVVYASERKGRPSGTGACTWSENTMTYYDTVPIVSYS